MALTHTENATRNFASFATKRLGNTLGGLETLKSLGKQLSLFIWQNLGKPFDCVLHVELNKDISNFSHHQTNNRLLIFKIQQPSLNSF